MVLFAAFIDSFYSNPETRGAKFCIPTGLGGWGEGGAWAQHWRLSVGTLSQPNVGSWPSLVSSLYSNGKDLGHPRRETCLSPVTLCFAELEPV